MSQVSGLVEGIASASSVDALLIIGMGVAIGILVGAIPGLGSIVGMAMVLPIIISFPPAESIWLLMAIVVGSAFGNSLTAIVLGIPGTPSAILSSLESEPFRRKGQELRAITVALLASTVGQAIAVLAFVALVIPLARFAVRFLFPEVFALTFFALLTVIGLSRGNPLKGAVAALAGFMFALIGPDPITSQIRFGFGMRELYTGLPTVPALIGLLAFREVFSASRRRDFLAGAGEGHRVQMPQLSWIKDYKSQLGSTGVGTGVGIVVGALPGAGPTVATFVTYGVLGMRKRIKDRLGKGSLDAIAGIDAAQNSASTSALIPTLALGIPGSAAMVLVMALLISRGVFPGPDIMLARADLVHAVFGGLVISVPFLLVIGWLTLGPAVFISRISHPAIVSGSIILMVVGVFSIRWSLIDVWVALGFGVLGYAMTQKNYPIAPMALALILAPIMETTLRRGLVMTRGIGGFFTRPVSATLLVLGVVFLLISLPRARRPGRNVE